MDTMSDKDSKNTVDTAQPHADAADRLSEDEKKALELGGLIEHEQGKKQTAMHDGAVELAGEPDAQ